MFLEPQQPYVNIRKLIESYALLLEAYTFMKDNTSKTQLFKNLFMRKRSERHIWHMHVQGSAPVAAVNVTRDIPVFNVLIYSLTLVVTFPT